jgi:hypothetical protein
VKIHAIHVSNPDPGGLNLKFFTKVGGKVRGNSHGVIESTNVEPVSYKS